MSLFKKMLTNYTLHTTSDVNNATRELMQEIALAGLYRGGFFDIAAFYGGTCLRIFYGLERFSEDLDFSLLTPNEKFSLKPYFKAIEAEFNALGVDVEVQEKNKTSKTKIESAFLKSTTSIYDIHIHAEKPIKIKFEVDTNPPQGFTTENKVVLQPFSFFVNTYSLPDLFAGKAHALLYRSWKKRVKGRDWFDFEWYVRNKTPLNLKHFAERALQSGHLSSTQLTKKEFVKILKNRINEMDIDLAKNDVRSFIQDKKTLSIWSTNYFLQLADLIKFDE